MEEKVPRRSRRVKNLPPIPFEYPPPPRRRRLNTTSSFEPYGSSDIVGELDSIETMASAPKDTRIRDIEAEGFMRSFNPPLTGVEGPVVVQIPDPRVTANTSYHVFQGLTQDDMAPVAEMVMTLVIGRSTPPYRNVPMSNPISSVGTDTSLLFSGSTTT